MLKMRQAAERIGVSPLTLRKWIEQGDGPSYYKTPGRMILFAEETVDKWLETLRKVESNGSDDSKFRS